MQKQLEVVVVKLCEKIPLKLAFYGLPITFFEEDGLCKKPNYNCKYRRKDTRKDTDSDDYSCTKKPYVRNLEPIKT